MDTSRNPVSRDCTQFICVGSNRLWGSLFRVERLEASDLKADVRLIGLLQGVDADLPYHQLSYLVRYVVTV